MAKQKRGQRIRPGQWLRMLLRQPPAGFYRKASVYQCGRDMEIENFRRILRYDHTGLCLELDGGILTVYGSGLVICSLAAHRVTLQGDIWRTDYASAAP